jgi:hypothetical protein
MSEIGIEVASSKTYSDGTDANDRINGVSKISVGSDTILRYIFT